MLANATPTKFDENVREAVLVAEWLLSVRSVGQMQQAIENGGGVDSQLRQFISVAIAFVQEPERVVVSCQDLLGMIRRDDF